MRAPERVDGEYPGTGSWKEGSLRGVMKDPCGEQADLHDGDQGSSADGDEATSRREFLSKGISVAGSLLAVSAFSDPAVLGGEISIMDTDSNRRVQIQRANLEAW